MCKISETLCIDECKEFYLCSAEYFLYVDLFSFENITKVRQTSAKHAPALRGEGWSVALVRIAASHFTLESGIVCP